MDFFKKNLWEVYMYILGGGMGRVAVCWSLSASVSMRSNANDRESISFQTFAVTVCSNGQGVSMRSNIADWFGRECFYAE